MQPPPSVSRVKITSPGADSQDMADARLGLLRTAPPLAPTGAFDDLPDASPQLTAISDLTNVVVWELVAPDAGIIWHAPFERLLTGQDPHGTYVVPPGEGGKRLYATELGEAVLAPLVQTVRAGVTWENYELVQEFEAPDGEVHRMLVRAVAVPDSVPARFLGVVADVSDPGEVPWITADVGERLTLLVEHSPDAIIVHQDGLVVYTNPAASAHGCGEVARGRHRETDHLVHQPRRPREHDRPPGAAQGPRGRGEGLRGDDGARRRERVARRGGERPHHAGAASPPSRSSCATSRSASSPRRRPRHAPRSNVATPPRSRPSKRAWS